MKHLSNYCKLLVNETDLVLRLLDQWHPRSTGPKEKGHEQDLTAWLQKCLPDVPIVTQYGIAKGKADIVIEDAHVIELKRGFDASSVAEFDRCIGQMERYLQKWVKKERGPVYLVIVGPSYAEFRDLLSTWFKEANDRCSGWTFFAAPPFHLVEKPLSP
jgi:hypothetical protein